VIADSVLIKTEGLEKAFGKVQVLKGITTEIHKGEVVVIIGPSGSGKSTFLRTLNLLEEPTGGKIYFEGVDITDPKININKHRQKMGMVFQQFNLFPHMTVLKNMTLAPMKLLKLSKADAEKRATELLDRVGLADRANAYPNQLSGGQKQRVAIARALITKPQIILADEPTGALDSKTSVEVMELLKTLNAEEGVTTIVVTHESGVANETNKIVHIKDGIIGKIEENLDHTARPFGINGIMK
jgi:polar amino acid transport system ATP-binding protein